MNEVISYEVVVSTDKECFVIEADTYPQALKIMDTWADKPQCKGREVFVQKVVRTKMLSRIGGK